MNIHVNANSLSGRITILGMLKHALLYTQNQAKYDSAYAANN